MRILYVTACLPYGPGETFIIGEIAELLGRNKVLVVPRSPGELGRHAEWLAPYSLRERLLSWNILRAALYAFIAKPLRTTACFGTLFRSRNLRTLLANLAVFPKGLWLARMATKWNAEHIHCHWAGTTATMAMIASRVSAIPWSVTTHRSDIVSNNLLEQKANTATAVRAIAEEGRRMLLSRGVPAAGKLLVLPMGVRIPASVPRRNADDRIVLCPADLLPVKGHRFLLEAWKLLLQRGLEASLWLAGSGELESALRAQVADLGMGNSVTFLGTIRHEELLGLYRTGRISAVVLASIDLGGGCHEGIPVALVEAMSYGVAVVGTATGGIPELIQPGTGVLVPPRNPSALADALEALLLDELFARATGESGRLRVVETRNIVDVAARLESIFAAGPGSTSEAPHQSQMEDGQESPVSVNAN